MEITLLGPQPGTATDVHLVGVDAPGREVGSSFRISGSLLDENVPRLSTAQFQHVIRRSRTGILETGDSSDAFVRDLSLEETVVGPQEGTSSQWVIIDRCDSRQVF